MILLNICSKFKIDIQQIISVKPYGSGHIHDTFKVSTKERNDYLLQKINTKVFTNIPALQSNIEKVINYIKAENQDSVNPLVMLSCVNGKSFFIDEKDDYWRCFVFIPKSKTYDRIISSDLAYEAGKAFGGFQNMLQKFPFEELHETLPKFHNINYRLSLFESSVKADIKKRLNSVENEIEFVRSRVTKMKRILELGQQNKIPLRVTHNDTKINNVLFDESDKAICVIDLDTVMPGYIHYDFGDAIRTGAASALEDETDLDKMYIDLDLFGGLYEYYIVAVYYFGESLPSNSAYALLLRTDKSKFRNIQIYPVPASDYINIRSTYLLENIHVLNNTGQIVIEKELNTMNYQINVSEFESGIYFLKLKTEEANIIRKIIIE